MKWIPVKETSRNQNFTCSDCGKTVFFIDGKAMGKNKTHDKAECDYPFCPYCKAERSELNE